jgi:hypothetical protein
MEEIIKIQMDLMNKMSNEMGNMQDSVKKLSSTMESFVAFQTANQKEARLPSQTEANPIQCGAVTVSTTSEVSGVTTRARRSTTVFDKQLEKTGILPKPYVTPPLRKNSNEGEIQPRSVKETEKDIAPKSNTLPVKIGNPPMNNTKEAATSSTILPEAIQMNKVPFPDRFEKSKEDKQFNKFLKIMKDVQVTIPVLDAVLHVPMYAKFFKDLMSKKEALMRQKLLH